MAQFEGKVVIVTGAGSGIGRVTAEEFVREGARVVLADVNGADVQALSEKLGSNTIAVTVDVSSYDDCCGMIQKTVEAFGGLDVLVNNAGVSGPHALLGDVSVEDWQQVININLSGVFYCTKAAIPAMKKSGGVIVNLSSIDGFYARASFSPYTAAKHGVLGLTKNTAMEYAKDNIRCVALAPGFIKTEMVTNKLNDEAMAVVERQSPMHRGADPVEVAELIKWVSSDKAAFVSGTHITIDGATTAGNMAFNVG